MSDGDERSVRAFLARSGADWLVAPCTPHVAALLRERDHHVVTVAGRVGLLLAYHLWSDPPPLEPCVFVLFRHTEGHPGAPAEVQRAVDDLAFVRGAAAPGG